MPLNSAASPITEVELSEEQWVTAWEDACMAASELVSPNSFEYESVLNAECKKRGIEC